MTNQEYFDKLDGRQQDVLTRKLAESGKTLDDIDMAAVCGKLYPLRSRAYGNWL